VRVEYGSALRPQSNCDDMGSRRTPKPGAGAPLGIPLLDGSAFIGRSCIPNEVWSAGWRKPVLSQMVMPADRCR
jgi:hypothetical protein